MRAHVVLAHPEQRSFNGRLARVSVEALGAAGWEVTLSDLYEQGFDPLEGPHHYDDRADDRRFHAQTEQRFHANRRTSPSDVAREIEHIHASDLLVVHFPLWWFGMPAMLKGWIDRVFVYGELYRSTERYDAGVCSGKRMIACVTTGASKDACAHDGREGDTRMHLWPMLFPFRYIGFDVLVPEVLHGIGGVAFVESEDSGPSPVERHIGAWADALRRLDARGSVPYNRDEDFDERTRLRPDAPALSPFVSHDRADLWPHT